MTEPRGSYTGRARRRENRWKVRAADLTARWVITVGGIATIVAVLLVFVFLVSVVAPLFWPAPSLDLIGPLETRVAARPPAVGLDEYRRLGWEVDEAGELHVFRLDTGATLERRPLLDAGRLVAISASSVGDDVVLGLEDGGVRAGRIGTRADFLASDALPEDLQDMQPGEVRERDGGIVERTLQGQYRLLHVAAEFGPAWQATESPIERLDHVSPSSDGAGGAPIVLAWSGGKLLLLEWKRNELTGEFRRGDLHELPVPTGWTETPHRLLLSGRADNAYLVSVSGRLARLEIREPAEAKVVEQTPLVERDRRLTLCQWVLGRETLLCGDDQGELTAWFRVATPDDAGADGWSLRPIHRLPTPPDAQGAAITAGDSSQRSRLFAVGYENGAVAVFHVTAERLVAETRAAGEGPITALALSPRDDGLVAWDGRRAWNLRFDPRYPEVSLGTLFGAIWYEGYEGPRHVWQSSFAGVEPEPKLGLWPLVFGTLKATLYSMLFGAPLALLAAIHASEFMAPRVRAQVKPAIEMMASLPSVVLGFLGALVLAPVVEENLAALLGVVLCVPTALLTGAQLWQLLPARLAPYAAPYRLPAIAATFVVGAGVGVACGPMLERLLFAGSLARWLDGQAGSAVSGWFLLLLPGCVVLGTIACGAVVNPWFRQRWGTIPRERFALLNLTKFLACGAACLALAWLLGLLLAAAGLDPRGSIVDTYVQRNALVVGFVMGFAIIPLIFTIADDALTTVPQHLRSASLGAGATPWQTAIRVVIPTAMSGLFSAVMIGLGRAVGETMIVLMAGGNTPIMQWNVFNGLRTLSANIAVELPEAVRDSAHYRTLFLAALTLFILTFFVNTAAELVRMRFRKRAYQL